MDSKIKIGNITATEILRHANRLGYYTHLIIPVEINTEGEEAGMKLVRVIENLLAEITKFKEHLDEIQNP